MDKIKHAVESMKEKVTGHHGQHHKQEAHETTPVKNEATHKSPAPVAAGHPDPPTHGHAHSNLDPPGAPGLIETPAPGVVASGASRPGLGSGILPKI